MKKLIAQTNRIMIFAVAVLWGVTAQGKELQPLSEEWQKLLQTLSPIVENIEQYLPETKDAQNQQELLDFIYSNVAMGYFGAVYVDADYPDFWPALNEVFRVGFPNPDDAYYFVPVDDDGQYRIAGYRGTVKILDFQINGGMAGKDGTGVWGPALSNYSADDLAIDDNGWFEVILSAERPDVHQGNWLKLEKGAAYIMVRQRSYDWLNEVDGRFGIERLDRPAIQPRLSTENIEQRLAQVAKWAETWSRLNLLYSQKAMQAEPNKFRLKDFSTEGGFTSKVQSYPQTVFQLAVDEALIVETEVPEECRYWNFQLVDSIWQTMGGNNQFNSINGHQAFIDDDGKFRMVVSAQDPGVPNWLDNMGYETGIVYGRWNICSSAPIPKATKVKVEEIRMYLPEATPHVSAEQRDTMLRERRLGAQLRRRW